MPKRATGAQKARARWRTELYKGKLRDSRDNKYKNEIKEPGLLRRWPMFLDLQVKLPDPGEAAALVEMRKMCPGKAATLEEIKVSCRQADFRTPYWKGKTH